MVRSENSSPKSRLRLVSKYRKCNISHLRFVKPKKKKQSHAASISYLRNEGRDIGTAKNRTNDLSLRLWRCLWRVICKGQFRTWIQWKVSTHLLHNYFQILFVFVLQITLAMFNYLKTHMRYSSTCDID